MDQEFEGGRSLGHWNNRAPQLFFLIFLLFFDLLSPPLPHHSWPTWNAQQDQAPRNTFPIYWTIRSQRYSLATCDERHFWIKPCAIQHSTQWSPTICRTHHSHSTTQSAHHVPPNRCSQRAPNNLDNVPPTRQANQCIRHWVHVFGFTNHSMLTPNARPNHTPNTLPAASSACFVCDATHATKCPPTVQQIDFSLGHCIGDVFDRQLYKLDRAHHELNTQTCLNVRTMGRPRKKATEFQCTWNTCGWKALVWTSRKWSWL